MKWLRHIKQQVHRLWIPLLLLLWWIRELAIRKSRPVLPLNETNLPHDWFTPVPVSNSSDTHCRRVWACVEGTRILGRTCSATCSCSCQGMRATMASIPSCSLRSDRWRHWSSALLRENDEWRGPVARDRCTWARSWLHWSAHWTWTHLGGTVHLCPCWWAVLTTNHRDT